MSSSTREDDSNDEFESADEGEPISPPITKPPTPPLSSDPILSSTNENPDQSISHKSPVTDGWDDWNIDDEQPNETPIKTSKSLQQDSISSGSSSPSKTGDSLSQIGSDEDDQSQSSIQQYIQRKKYRKKQNDLNLNLNKEDNKQNTQLSHSIQRHDEETSSSTTTTTKHDSTWHNPWSNFGSFLSTAKQSVSTLTNTVSEGLNAVIESVEAGLGAPDPQQLAEMNRMAFKIKGETSDSEDEPEASNIQTERNDSVTNQDGWLNALSLEKLTNTGMKVVAGSLDVLETVGKKTFDVINEADPALQGTRRLLRKQNQPTLSEVSISFKERTSGGKVIFSPPIFCKNNYIFEISIKFQVK
ncbi:unnamed protein product [Rotaria sp. Silwood2]|nr:unnamed protein product [Rotaria sp. Silwood2]